MEKLAGLSNHKEMDKTEERPPGWSFTHMWTTLGVSRFIQDIGYPRYAQCFRNNMIDGRDLKELTAFDLQRIGVDNMKDAMRMHTIIKRVTKKELYNFEDPHQPLNVSYVNVNIGSQDANISYSKPFYMAPISHNELRLPYRNSGSRYERYHLTLPTIHHQRSICTRKMDDSMAHATLNNK